MRQLRFATAVAVTMAVSGSAQALTILETAFAGPGVGHAGVAIDEQYLGARFDLTAFTEITAIGGHIQRATGSLFGAIVELGSSTALPGFAPSDLLTSSLTRLYLSFDLPATPGETVDLMLDASVILEPGSYGLVFGGVDQGTGGAGRMPTTDIDIGAPSYFFGDTGGWRDGGFSDTRFVVEGDLASSPRIAPQAEVLSAVPLPPGLALLAGAMGLLALRRRRAACTPPSLSALTLRCL